MVYGFTHYGSLNILVLFQYILVSQGNTKGSTIHPTPLTYTITPIDTKVLI